MHLDCPKKSFNQQANTRTVTGKFIFFALTCFVGRLALQPLDGDQLIELRRRHAQRQRLLREMAERRAGRLVQSVGVHRARNIK